VKKGIHSGYIDGHGGTQGQFSFKKGEKQKQEK